MNALQIQSVLQSALAMHAALRHIHVHAELPSTNSWLMDRDALPVGEAEVAIALHQTAGRGRRGREWQAPPESGLCLSMAWHFDAMPENPGAISLALGVAVARALESLGTGEIMLKWPNDLVWQDRKLGGILVESATSASGFRVVAGVGINVALPEAFALNQGRSWSEGPVDLKRIGVEASIAQLAEVVIPEWLAAFASFGSEADGAMVDAFNRRHWLLDRAAEREGQMLRCGAVDPSGRLTVVDMQSGEEAVIDSGEVTPIAWSEAS
ncbi:MAG: biotin--[acetyl-CoA-carboxylase] ligase [Pseudomonadota bacterium]